ncbi:ribonuclease inhibitor-like [Trichomycterus rosablanca]|uniref:ribonuclease inhibitor-like n=1 Tax=Trichomycterus rosablanca TaxID=2290929 RepID=UPI002F3512E6
MIISLYKNKFAAITTLPKLPSTFETAQLLFDQVFKIHGIPQDIVSDRGPQFVSQVWCSFCKALGTSVSLSSGFHPQSNGQAERANQELEAALHCITASNPSQWSTQLAWVEYAHNCSATGRSPIEASLGYQSPHFAEQEQELAVPSVKHHIRRCRKVWRQITRLSQCNLTDEGCSALFQVLSSDSSTVRELDLSNNQIQDSGVRLISDLLNNPNCKLHTVRLSDCGVREEGYAALAEALRSNPSSELMELDLGGNDPGDSGVKPLYDLLQHPNCKLKKLGLSDCEISDEGYVALAGALMLNPSSPLTDLDLSGNNPGTKGMKMFNDLLKKPKSKLRVRFLSRSPEMNKACDYLNKMDIKMLELSEVDLSGRRNVGDSGVKHVSTVLKDPHCTITKLILSDCKISDEGYVALAGALMLNPSSPLTDLDLSGNNPGTEGMKMFNDLLKKPKSKLRVRFLSRSPEMNKACDYLNKMGIKMLELSEVDLRRRNIGDSGVKHLSTVLKDPHCMITKLTLRDCEISDEGYVALAGALMLNPSSPLTDLDLSGNNPGTEGMKMFNDLLKKPKSKLRVRFLSPEMNKACDYLNKMGIKMLDLSEVDLSGRNIGDSGVKHVSTVLKDPHCMIIKLTLRNCSITDKSCTDLKSALDVNPSHLKDLDLSNNQLGDSGVIQISHLLKDPQFKLHKLTLIVV